MFIELALRVTTTVALAAAFFEGQRAGIARWAFDLKRAARA